MDGGAAAHQGEDRILGDTGCKGEGRILGDTGCKGEGHTIGDTSREGEGYILSDAGCEGEDHSPKGNVGRGDHGTPEEEATTAPMARYYRGGTEEYSCARGRQALGSVGTTGPEQLGGFGRSVGALDRKAIVASPASQISEGFGDNGTRDAAESGASFSKGGTFAEGGIFSESSGIRGSVFTEGGGTEGGNTEVGGTSSAPATIISAAYSYGATTSTGGGPLPVRANELCGCPAQGNSVQPIGGEF